MKVFLHLFIRIILGTEKIVNNQKDLAFKGKDTTKREMILIILR